MIVVVVRSTSFVVVSSAGIVVISDVELHLAHALVFGDLSRQLGLNSQ